MINLNKGQVIDLSKEAGGSLSKIKVGLGWSGKRGRIIDLDSYIGLKDGQNNAISLVYFSHTDEPGIHHNGDDLTGGGRANDPNEEIDVDVTRLSTNVISLEIGLFVYSSGISFDDIKDAFIAIWDGAGKELIRFNIADFAGAKSLIAGTLKKVGSEWKFKADGIPSFESVRDVRKRFSTGSNTSRPVAVQGAGAQTPTPTPTPTPRRGFFSRLLNN